MVEHQILVALERGAAAVLPKLVGELGGESDGADAVLRLRVADAEHVLHEVDVAPAQGEQLEPTDPVSTSVRNATRACSSSPNDLATLLTSTGSRMRQWRRPSLGRSTRKAGFDSTSSSRIAVLNTSTSTFTSRFTVAGA
jgi:hypothetical protein